MSILPGYILFLSTILTSCKDDSIAAKVYSKCNKQGERSRQAKTVINFEWDRVYILSVGACWEYIEKDSDISYNESGDIADRIIFVDNCKVV